MIDRRRRRRASKRRQQAGSGTLSLIWPRARAYHAQSTATRTTHILAHTSTNEPPSPCFFPNSLQLSVLSPSLFGTPKEAREGAVASPLTRRCRARRARSTWPSSSTRACASSWPEGGKVSTESRQRRPPPAGRASADSQPTYQHTHHITVAGVLKGYDQLLNLVLDEAREFLRGALAPSPLSSSPPSSVIWPKRNDAHSLSRRRPKHVSLTPHLSTHPHPRHQPKLKQNKTNEKKQTPRTPRASPTAPARWGWSCAAARRSWW